MTAARDLHDTDTKYLLSAWPNLPEAAQHYTVHWLYLLYMETSKGWSAALYYNHKGADEFLDILPDV
jgi:hypothetical protein